MMANHLRSLGAQKRKMSYTTDDEWTSLLRFLNRRCRLSALEQCHCLLHGLIQIFNQVICIFDTCNAVLIRDEVRDGMRADLLRSERDHLAILVPLALRPEQKHVT